MVCLRQNISLQTFQRLSSTNFTWSIPEYLDPNKPVTERRRFVVRLSMSDLFVDIRRLKVKKTCSYKHVISKTQDKTEIKIY